jgi:hypothetical protein
VSMSVLLGMIQTINWRRLMRLRHGELGVD